VADFYFDENISKISRHAGILIVKQPPVLAADDAAMMIHTFVTEMDSIELLANRCLHWQPPRGWREIE
jgi:hypothetical protein